MTPPLMGATASEILSWNSLDRLPDDPDERRRTLRRMLAQWHPDRHGGEEKAQRVFVHLTTLAAHDDRRGKGFDLTTRRRTYHVGPLAYRGSVSNLYEATYVRDGQEKDGLLHLPRSPRDSDLVTAAADSLRKVWATDSRRRAFYPRLEESFRHRDSATGKTRTAMVLRTLPGFHSLAEVLAAYPSGLDARDLAWMWRRALAAVSLAHEVGVVHGALVPEHVLIHPASHGLLLVGWSSSVPEGQRIKALGGDRSLYPPEVLAKEPATRATDVYTLHKTMERMLAPSAPRQFRSFVQGCTFDRPGVRPTDARSLLGEFDELLGRLYGPRKFREFRMPQSSPEHSGGL